MDDQIYRQAAIDAHCEICGDRGRCNSDICPDMEVFQLLPSAQSEREDYTEMKREFLRMASYIDSLLVCLDEQKETLMNFISRIADDMPWTERD